MKKLTIFSVLSLVIVFLPGCQIIGDIFKAGVWVGIFLVVVIVGLIFWLIGKGKK